LPSGFSKLREKQKFSLTQNKGVILNFGKHTGKSFSQIGDEDPEYLQFIIDTMEEKLSAEVRSRLIYWLNKKSTFWV